MKPIAWSHTALDDFQNCPRAFYEKRIAKSVTETKSEQMIWGEWVHKQFEDRQKEGKPLPETLKEHEAFMQVLESSPGEAYTERKVALAKDLSPCGFFDKDVWCRGVIDFAKVAGEKAVVVDYKTGKPHSKYKQLKLFALQTFAEFPEVNTINVQYYWTQTQVPTGQVYTRAMTNELWSDFTPVLKQYLYAFKENVWQPRPSGLCNGWCPVTDCEFWKPRKIK